MSALRAVVFDYGHTILNFQLAEEQLLTCYEEIRRRLEARAEAQLPGASELAERISRRVEAMVQESYAQRQLEEVDIVELFERALGGLGLRLGRDEVHDIAEYEHRTMAAHLQAPTENLEVLRSVRGLGLRVGIVSNAHFLPAMMWEDIRRLGIAQYVDDAVFSSEIGVRKPHPAIFTKVLDTLGVQPAEAIFVGDRLRDDIGGAKALGMRAVLTHQFRQEPVDGVAIQPDLIIEQLPDLLPWIRRQMGTGSD